MHAPRVRTAVFSHKQAVHASSLRVAIRARIRQGEDLPEYTYCGAHKPGTAALFFRGRLPPPIPIRVLLCGLRKLCFSRRGPISWPRRSVCRCDGKEPCAPIRSRRCVQSLRCARMRLKRRQPGVRSKVGARQKDGAFQAQDTAGATLQWRPHRWWHTLMPARSHAAHGHLLLSGSRRPLASCYTESDSKHSHTGVAMPSHPLQRARPTTGHGLDGQWRLTSAARFCFTGQVSARSPPTLGGGSKIHTTIDGGKQGTPGGNPTLFPFSTSVRHPWWPAACRQAPVHAAGAGHSAGRTMWQPDRVSLLGYCTAGARSYELVQDACL